MWDYEAKLMIYDYYDEWKEGPIETGISACIAVVWILHGLGVDSLLRVWDMDLWIQGIGSHIFKVSVY